MSNLNTKSGSIAKEIIAGRRLTKEDNLSFLLTEPLEELSAGADEIRRELRGNTVSFCAIINGRQGGCSENCRFCSQSAHNHTGLSAKKFADVTEMVEDCIKYDAKGVHRYSIVTAGRGISRQDLDKACEAYSKMHEACPGIKLCASHGMMEPEDFFRVKECGVDMYHENIETSRNFFTKVCTTHTFDDKLATIRNARAAGLKICCGGILGMGESWEDRIDMALTIAELKAESVPLNALMPMKGTPLEGQPTLTEDEILRCICLFRYLCPESDIRLAAGRTLMEDSGRKAFLCGANATLTGDMLTTGGNNTDQDFKMLSEMGFDLNRN